MLRELPESQVLQGLQVQPGQRQAAWAAELSGRPALQAPLQPGPQEQPEQLVLQAQPAEPTNQSEPQERSSQRGQPAPQALQQDRA